MARLPPWLVFLSSLFLGAVSAAEDIVFGIRVVKTLAHAVAPTVAAIDVAAPAASSSLPQATSRPETTWTTVWLSSSDDAASLDASSSPAPPAPATTSPVPLLGRADAAGAGDRWEQLTVPSGSNIDWTSYVSSIVKERAGPDGKDPVTLSIPPEYSVFRGQILDLLSEPLRQERIQRRQGWLNKQFDR
jgi:hypothetical protein